VLLLLLTQQHQQRSSTIEIECNVAQSTCASSICRYSCTGRGQPLQFVPTPRNEFRLDIPSLLVVDQHSCFHVCPAAGNSSSALASQLNGRRTARARRVRSWSCLPPRNCCYLHEFYNMYLLIQICTLHANAAIQALHAALGCSIRDMHKLWQQKLLTMPLITHTTSQSEE